MRKDERRAECICILSFINFVTPSMLPSSFHPVENFLSNFQVFFFPESFALQVGHIVATLRLCGPIIGLAFLSGFFLT